MKKLILFLVLGLFLISFISAQGSQEDFEAQAIEIAKAHTDFINKTVQDVLTVADFDYKDLNLLKSQIFDFYNSREGEIWFNLGTDNNPIEQRRTIPLYDEITFIDSSGQEVIRYSGSFLDELRDVSNIVNTDFKSETYFEDTKNLSQGEVFIGKVMTWYTSFDRVFSESNDEIREGKIYEEVVGRDVMKRGLIRFSSPIYNGEEFLGVIVLSLDYRHFQELSKHIVPLSEDKVSSTYAGNYLLIFDNEGNTIVHPKPDNIRGYLEDGDLAGYNEPNSSREGHIFNLYKYQGSFAYSELAKTVLEDEEIFYSSATDIGGRTKVVVAAPIICPIEKTYSKEGCFGGIMLSIQLEEGIDFLGELNLSWVIILGIFVLLVATIIIGIYYVKRAREGVEGKEPTIESKVFGKITRKFGIILTLILFSIVLVSFLIIYFQNQALEDQYFDAISEIESDFLNIEMGSVRTLSATLEPLLVNPDLKKEFLKGDREMLYITGKELFEELKWEYDITHFYFITPEGEVFLRMHNKDIYGDKLNRLTYIEAKETNSLGAGIELGKTAYALRVVKPYYDGEELIGYLELGQEIDNFFDLIKGESLNQFSLIAKKDLIDEENWVSVRETKGIRNNWNDFEDYVLIESTTEKKFSCFSDKNSNKLFEELNYLEISELDERSFACGGFPLVDASDRISGGIYSLIDVTEEKNLMINIRIILLIIMGLIALFFIFVGGYVSRKISKPILDLTALAEEVGRKNFKKRVSVKTGDELETLGNTLNKTTEVLENMDSEYKKLDKAKTEFLSITSHELRSPMTPMRAQLQMLMKGYFGKLNGKQKEALEIVLSNTQRLDGIIIDFLEISRIEAARLKFNFIKADLRITVKKVLEEMKGFMPEKNIRLVNKVEKLPKISVDPDRVSQILRNLINNAIKFTRENGEIVVGGRLKSGKIEFYVKDNGIGINTEDQNRLFEPFYQAENMYQHKSGGTGLGLAICKGIVESQKGKIWIQSVLNEGTTFYFTIPLKPVKEIEPIKLLFSPKTKIEEGLEQVFLNNLGPLGKEEFEFVKHNLDEESIKEYVKDLKNRGILTGENAEEFKKDIRFLISNNGVNSSGKKRDKK